MTVTLKSLRKKEFDFTPKSLGEHIKRERLKRGLTQEEAAKFLGVSPWTVLNWETGATKPHVQALPAIIAFLGYDPRPEPITIAERLRAYRAGIGLSLKKMSAQLGVEEGTLGDWERGKIVLFRKHRQVIAELLRISIHAFGREMASRWGKEHSSRQ